MSHNKNIIENLHGLVERLGAASYNVFGNQLKYFIAFIENNRHLSQLIEEVCNKYKISEKAMEQIFIRGQSGRLQFEFENEQQHAANSYMILKRAIKDLGSHNIHDMVMFQSREWYGTKHRILHEMIAPIVYYLNDKLEKSGSVIYLLERYKQRVEWFTKGFLLEKYLRMDKNYEQILEDDLRLFLFDQGIDYPFSTPKSASGRADIVGEIDTSDPIIIEIKICDKDKNYGKKRIKDGFTQIVNYSNDYNKDVGYLVIFNIDNTELRFNFDADKKFPVRFEFNGKHFYFIIINLSTVSASKQGSLDTMNISEDDLIK